MAICMLIMRQVNCLHAVTMGDAAHGIDMHVQLYMHNAGLTAASPCQLQSTTLLNRCRDGMV